ncbi:heme-binding protein soul2 [Paramormyrops kingsleyae]|uniref:Heme-binding protein soul2 n=1 Tax=Paramormyrops kingsleyae TaxID=1676925 RepID=A0A3B3RF26_9TELE|nr:heme-binding protein 2-like [Paramormyrops kingsleyae]
MAAILCVFCLFLALTSAAAWSAPWFCHGHECPPYELIGEYETFEERYYNASRWIMTGIESTASSVVYDGFMKLYGYTDGENERSQKIPMTLPVIVATSQSDKENDRLSISFYVPPNLDLPAPTNADVESLDRPEGRVFVRAFGGIASESDWLENVSELREYLLKEGKEFDAKNYVAAGYDPPWKLFFRHNEVWIPAV